MHVGYSNACPNHDFSTEEDEHERIDQALDANDCVYPRTNS